ncbi:MAG: hypothetical protein ACON4O_08345 [Lentimonas sp.]
MNREEAKNILQLCRPGVAADLEDPLIAEAFQMLEQDSELMVWFEQQQAFDTEFSAQLENIEPPADLKASILAGMRAHQKIADAPEPETDPDLAPEPFFASSEPDLDPDSVPEPLFEKPKTSKNTAPQTCNASWWRSPWIGIAALLVLMLVFTQLPRESGDRRPARTDPALSGLPPILPFLSEQIDEMKFFSFDKRDRDVNTLRAYLASKGAPSPKDLPQELAKIGTLGCVTFNFEGSKLSMICFDDGNVYHLITADAADFLDLLQKTPRVYELDDKAFKIWVEDDLINILTIHGTKEEIPQFI